jgi:hypothetical protein
VGKILDAMSHTLILRDLWCLVGLLILNALVAAYLNHKEQLVKQMNLPVKTCH